MAKSYPIYVGDLYRGGNTVVGTFDKQRLKVRRSKQPFSVELQVDPINARASCGKHKNLWIRCLDDFNVTIDGTEVEQKLYTLRINRHYYLANQGGFQTGVVPEEYKFMAYFKDMKKYDHDYGFRLLDIDPRWEQWFSFYYILHEESTFVGRYGLVCVSEDLKERTGSIPVLVRFNKAGEVIGVAWNDVFGVVRGSKYYDKTLVKYFVMRDY